MTTRRILPALTAFLLDWGRGCSGAEGKTARPEIPADPGGARREAEEMLAAVVRVRMKAIPNARSNATLGPSREGTAS